MAKQPDPLTLKVLAALAIHHGHREARASVPKRKPARPEPAAPPQQQQVASMALFSVGHDLAHAYIDRFARPPERDTDPLHDPLP
jgi:hypothetical protein